jgi:hypothetical protein
VKKLLQTVSAVLALNFLLLAGGAGWLVQQKRLDRERIFAIRDVLFPPPAEAPLVQPAATQSSQRLEELLARVAGRSAAEQIEYIQHAFDAQMAQLDRRERELLSLQRQIDLARDQMSRDRAALASEQQTLEQTQEQAERLAQDQGFQDTLALYNTMSGKQVKQIFMTLEDEAVMQYLQAMQPRKAAAIIKEFKTADEVQRIQRVLEAMRQAQVSIKE